MDLSKMNAKATGSDCAGYHCISCCECKQIENQFHAVLQEYDREFIHNLMSKYGPEGAFILANALQKEAQADMDDGVKEALELWAELCGGKPRYPMDIQTMLDHIKAMQSHLKGHPRTLLHPFAALGEECGELSTEIQISMGLKDKAPGPDGIVGESVDAILCLLDIIVVHQPDITFDCILALMNRKMEKWERKYATQ